MENPKPNIPKPDALIRVSSLDKLLETIPEVVSPRLINNQQIAARNVIVNWLKKTSSVRSVYHQLKQHESLCHDVLHAISNLSKISTLVEAQSIISDPTFAESLSVFLNILPRDPSLKAKNKQAKNFRIISSAILIKYFPTDVLQEEEGISDKSQEAQECIDSSNRFVFALIRMLSTTKKETSIATFRLILIGYRFCCREYLSKLDAWKLLDVDRTKKSFESAYMETLSVYLSVQKSCEVITNQLSTVAPDDKALYEKLIDDQTQFIEMLQAVEIKLNHIRLSMSKIWGNDATLKSRLEEINTFVNMNFNKEFLTADSTSILDGIKSNQSPTSVNQQHQQENLKYISKLANTKEFQQLQKLATGANLHVHNLIHEIIMNPNYQFSGNKVQRLPELQITDENFLIPLPLGQVDSMILIKNQMLNLIRDQLVATLKLSQVEASAEIVVNSIQQIRYTHEDSFTNVKVISASDDKFEVKVLANETVIAGVPYEMFKRRSDGRDPAPFIQALFDLRARISELIPHRNDLHQLLERSIDVDLIRQQVVQNVITTQDVLQIFSFIKDMLTNLLSPGDGQKWETWYNEYVGIVSNNSFDDFAKFIPLFIEAVFQFVDIIQLELANYYLSNLVPFVLSNLTTFSNESLHFAIVDKVDEWSVNIDGSIYSLPRSFQFLKSISTTELFNEAINIFDKSSYLTSVNSYFQENGLDLKIEDFTNAPIVLFALCAQGLNLLLQFPPNIKQLLQQAVPETMSRDLFRLLEFRNDIDTIAIISTISISLKQFLFGLNIKSIQKEDESKCASKLATILLSDNLTLQTLLDESKDQVRFLIQREYDSKVKTNTIQVSTFPNAASLIPLDWETTLSELIQRNIRENSQIFSLFSSRIHKLLFKGLMDLPLQDSFANFSIHSKTQIDMVSALIRKMKIFLVNHFKLYRHFYGEILTKLLHI